MSESRDGQHDLEPRFSDDEARLIIRRALELQVMRGELWNERDLVSIAGELGVDREAVQQAIAEASVAAQPAVRPYAEPVAGLLLAGLGAASFIPTDLLGGTGLPAVMVVGAASVALSLDSADRDSVRRYLGRNVWLWGGFWIGGTTQFHMTLEPTLLMIMGTPVLAGMGGIWLMRFLRRLRSAGTNRTGPGLLSRVAVLVRDRLSRRKDRKGIVECAATCILRRLSPA